MTAFLTDTRFHDLEKAIWDNADYLEQDSQAKAGRLQTALKRYILLSMQRASMGTGSHEYQQDLETKKKLLDEVKTFFTAKRSLANAGFRVRGFTRMRVRNDP